MYDTLHMTVDDDREIIDSPIICTVRTVAVWRFGEEQTRIA